MNRKLLITIHTLLAGFFFITAMLFLITGGLMSLGVDGDHEESNHILQLKQKLPSDIHQLKAIVAAEMLAKGLSLPKGKLDLEMDGDQLGLEWEGAHHSVILESSNNPLQATLTIESAGNFRYLTNLHKSEGGNASKVLAVTWALGLLTLLLTGILMAWQSPKYKILSLQAMGAGAVCVLIVAYFS